MYVTDNTETGTIVSLVYDIPRKRITTLLAFSKGEPYICLFLGQPLFLAPPPPLLPFLLGSVFLFPFLGKGDQDGSRFADVLPRSKKKGHWENPEAAQGDKRNPADLERWRGLARIGSSQTDRHLLQEYADIVEVFRGKGDLESIDRSWPTL